MEQNDRRPGRASERGITPRKPAAAKPPAALFLPPPAAEEEVEPEEPETTQPARRTSAPAAAFRAAPVAEQLTVDLPTVPAARPPTAAPLRFESEPEPPEIQPAEPEEAAPVAVRRPRKSSEGTGKASPAAEQTEIIEVPAARAPKKAAAKRTPSRTTDQPATPRTTDQPATPRATKPRKAAAKRADTPPVELPTPAPETIVSATPIDEHASVPMSAPNNTPDDNAPDDKAPQDKAAAAETITTTEPEPKPAATDSPDEAVDTTEAQVEIEAPADDLPSAVLEDVTTAEDTAEDTDGETEPETAAVGVDPGRVVLNGAAPAAEASDAGSDDRITVGDHLTAADGITAGTNGGPMRGVAVPRTRAEVVSSAELWAAVREQPRRAPAALALAAVARHAATARRQADWLRRTYPHVDPDRLARVSIATASRRARVAALASTLPLGGVAGLSAQLWAHARMVLEIATLYGFDPAEPARAAEMLALLGVYPEVGAATAAVRAIRGEPDDDRAMPAPRVGVATGAFVRKAAGRLVPGSAIVLAALGGAVDVDDLAARTVRFYRARRA